MRNFSWSCFQVTGNIDAYLLYKDIEGFAGKVHEVDHIEVEDEETN